MLLADWAMFGLEHILQNTPEPNHGDSAHGISIIGCSRVLAWYSCWCAHQYTETSVHPSEKPTTELLSQERHWQLDIVEALLGRGRSGC